ncbi:hypothetical protein [Sphingobacterium detergens]|uniref:Tetratricopeptide repeat protein n=1 Tax=Sphingobacterium detergens TaxID=1145106 RepID=A0A420ARN5_SPHD1|nr:hypothetical protein [Sphingobacterium detergens]RKE47128.1 hypothetical protein DFQ12_4289 [Sphingobacterium detergens]
MFLQILNKRKAIAITIFLFCVSNARASDNYFELVNRAELEIVSGNFTTACKLYNLAFQINHKPFAIDLNNAAISAIYSNQLKLAIDLCKDLAGKGVGPQFFTKSAVFSKLEVLRGWNQLLAEASTQKENLKNKNASLLGYIDSLVKQDQYVNSLWRNAEPKDKRKARDFMDLTYDTISHKLKKLFDSVGFISENLIGVKIINDTIINPDLPFDVIIIHNYQAQMNGEGLFTPVLKHAFTTGLISSKYFASIQGYSGGSPGNDYQTSGYYVQYNCNIYKQKMRAEDLKTVNKLRASIFLDSLDDNLKKLVFQIRNPDTKFIFSANASRYMNFADKNSENSFLMGTDLILENICN